MKLPVLAAVLLFAVALISSARAGDFAPTTGINSLPVVEFSQLSQQDRTALGAKALAINPPEWKHGETEHFIYHFQRGYVATPVSVEAEFYFRVISKELAKGDVPWTEKAHIYIFERPADWEAFQTSGRLEPWTGGIQSGGSLFIVRNPAYRYADNTLGHEIAHLVLRRFYGERIPLWLNEGFAQFVSKGAYASFQRARGYSAKPWSSGVAREKLFGLAEITTMGYPPADQVEAFYDQSERLVRFLAAADREKFLKLIELSTQGHSFEAALASTSGTRFTNFAAFEEQFVAYAVKDATSAALTP